MKVKKSGNGNGAGRPVGMSVPAEVLADQRPVGTVIKINDQQKAELSTINNEITNLKIQLGELAFAADDIERRRQSVVEQIRQSAEKLKALAGEVVLSYGLDPNNPASGTWSLLINEGRIQRTG